MVYFNSDYMAGAHPQVMELLNETNLLHTTGYGTDAFTAEARAAILKECGLSEGEVYFLVGGTQTNQAVIDRLLDRNDGVVAADTAHINTHESGAIELTGHKVIALPGHEGKLRAADVDRCAELYHRDDSNLHLVRPAMVYISFPTELGTVYSLEEMEELYDVCRKWDMPLYVDGARLAYGLAAEGGVSSIKDIARLCDAFYIGGTKCGTLFGEAVVTRQPDLFPRFASLMKMHGALLAKGRLLSVQFKALFANGLYYEIGHHAVRLAIKLKAGVVEMGYKLFSDSPTNQQFVVLPNEVIRRLREHVSFELWEPEGESETAVRFVTDWSTTEADIDELLFRLRELKPL